MMFERLFDDAALFPPGDAPMDVAVAAHRARGSALVGPFVVTARHLDAVAVQLEKEGPPLELALIAAADDLPAAAGKVGKTEGLRLAAVETPVAAGAAQALAAVRVARDVLPPDVPVAVEIPRTDARDDVLDALAGTGCRAKLRTGGIRADLFPPAQELAATIRACADRGIAFKCTAGLHHAIRHTDPATGFHHHGFLNVLLAAAHPTDAEAHLRRTDTEAIVADVRGCETARRSFTSFGTCSVAEPVDDLIGLGLLPAHERITA
ncbi:hypothetical protein Ade02nite_13900 [Paractinoplanes deccanensis]|uniref:Uncharacterized protein n=1 Tax=Paractinoplanes deccanensis TaxID=113561 RepID=A0ABQ3XYF3_9ACTN|nr:hypothetical protein [Actinoplanes deccanensis]GID72749.1 hypothetical protein Ade02nite_13900 [Actinoplanes deccanensis]